MEDERRKEREREGEVSFSTREDAVRRKEPFSRCRSQSHRLSPPSHIIHPFRKPKQSQSFSIFFVYTPSFMPYTLRSLRKPLAKYRILLHYIAAEIESNTELRLCEIDKRFHSSTLQSYHLPLLFQRSSNIKMKLKELESGTPLPLFIPHTLIDQHFHISKQSYNLSKASVSHSPRLYTKLELTSPYSRAQA